MTTEERISLLEAQVDILRRAIGLLTTTGLPTVKWMDASFAALAPAEETSDGRT